MWMSLYIETPIKAAIIKLLLNHRRIFSNIEGINSYVDVKTWRFEPLVHEQAGISDYIQYRFHNIYQGLKIVAPFHLLLVLKNPDDFKI